MSHERVIDIDAENASMMKEAVRGMLYCHPRGELTTKECTFMAKQRPRDAFGTKHPFPGLFAASGSAYHQPGTITRYNGGCVRGDNWYPGEFTPYPKIPAGFRLIHRLSWGVYIEDLRPKEPNTQPSAARLQKASYA